MTSIKKCEICGKHNPKREDAKYCGNKCRQAAWRKKVKLKKLNVRIKKINLGAEMMGK